jgi:hypothetical protein
MPNRAPRREHRRRPSRPWRKNLRRLQPGVLERVARFPKDDCVVACVRKIGAQQVKDGTFAHVGIRWEGDDVAYQEQLVPSVDNGRYSRENVDGKEIRLTSLPKITKTYSALTPNWGDWSNGSHLVSWDRNVYQRRFVPPRELGLRIERLADDVAAQAYVLRFTVDEVLDRTAPDFADRLFFDLNLLQENAGHHGVFPSDAPLADYVGTLYVTWELLPPGERDSNIARIFRTVKTDDARVRARIEERYDVLERLRPLQFVHGTNGFRNYFGARFAPDLVVFENVDYGNAVYVMFEDWETLSQKSRTELLAKHPDEFVRIAHANQWKARLRDVIARERRKRQAAQAA